jgi:hypothetical protein
MLRNLMTDGGRRILGKSSKAQTEIAGRCREWFMSAENEEMEANGKERRMDRKTKA